MIFTSLFHAQHQVNLIKALLSFCIILMSLLVQISSAQTRSLSGVISLDVGTSDIERTIIVSVRNHSITVVPPFFSIIRPVTSVETTTVVLPQGSSSVAYSVQNIISNPVDYSVALQCVNCTDNFPIQYYASSGNRFTLGGPTFIDPADLPSTLNITAITRSTISGDIILDQVADRALNFSIDIFSSQRPELSFQTLSSITLEQGQRSVSYIVNGLNRSIGLDLYGVRLQCTNCFARSRAPITFERLLSAEQNHSSINFEVTDEESAPIAPILNLLLATP